MNSTDEDKEGPKKSAAALLVDLALERYEFGTTPEGEAFAIPLPGGHVVRPLRGGRASLRAELAKAYRSNYGKIAGQQALADALLVLEGEAQETDPEQVHLRVAEHRGVTWVDLGDAGEHVVRIDAHGWDIVDRDVPVLFRRTALTGVLPHPEHGGALDELWSLLNVAEDDRPLVLAWLVAALGDPGIPHPVLALLGEQGTGKSTACRTVVELVDPSPVPLRKPPRDADGWVTAASGSWVVGLDNISTIPEWLSDTLCRAVTGDGDVRRQLYTDAGLAVFAFRRALVLNGIDVGAMRNDLADRAILVNLERIGENRRLTERQLDAAWTAAWPRTFGALLSEVAGVKRVHPSVDLGTSPRMADFAVIVAALDQIHGTNALGRYGEQARTMAEDAVTSDPFIGAVVAKISEFEGTASELRDEVTPTEDGWRPPRGWPANARAAVGLLKRNAPALRRIGWTVEQVAPDPRSKVARWRLVSTREGRETTPPTSATSVPAGVADVSDVVLRTSQVECMVCGEPFTAPGLTTRCRPQHYEAGAA